MALLSFPGRHRGLPRALALAGVVCGAAVLTGAPASAADSGALTPFLDCVSSNAQTGVDTAYFGYRNTLANGLSLPVGDNNQVFPASPFQGQPTYFETGTYPRVYSVTWDSILFPSIAWILDGQEADAYTGATACTSGVTSPATAVTPLTATLTGVVVPTGPDDTSYSFAYGTTSATTSTTPVQDLGSGTQPQLVQVALTGLKPSTTYSFHLDATSDAITTPGRTLTFRTAAAVPLAISTTKLAAATVHTAYTAHLAGSGTAAPYSWTVSQGKLPAGLTLNRTTGVLSGKPGATGSYSFTVKLTSSALPSAKAVTRKLALTVKAAPKKK